MVNYDALLHWIDEPDPVDDPLGYSELRISDLWADDGPKDLVESLKFVGLEPVPVWAPASVGRWMQTFASSEVAAEYMRILERADATVADVAKPHTIDRRTWNEALRRAANAIASVVATRAEDVLENADLDEELEKVLAEAFRDIVAFQMLEILALVQAGFRFGGHARAGS